MGMISILVVLLVLFAIVAFALRKSGRRPASRDDSDIAALSGLSAMTAASELGASDSGSHDGGSHDGGGAGDGGGGD